MSQDLDKGQAQFPGTRYYMGDSHGWFQRPAPLIDVTCYPFLADPDGTRDSTVGIQAAINLAQQIGGRLYFPQGIFSISSTLVIGNGASGVASTVGGVRLIGAGPPQSAYSGYTASAPTKLIWNGPSSGVMVQIAGPLQGWGLEDLQLDGNNLSATCLQVVSAEGGHVRSCHFVNCLVGVHCFAWTAAPPGFTEFDALHNFFGSCAFVPQNVTGAAAIKLFGNAGITADSAYNRFDNIRIVFPISGISTIYGIWMQVCDSNVFTDIHMFGGTATMAALAFDYSVTGAFPQANTFFGLDYKASASIQQAINIGSPSGAAANTIFGLMQANGASDLQLANLIIFANSGISTGTIFQTWTPTLSASVGTLGTTTINAARFNQVGRGVNFYLDVSITSAGTTPSGEFRFTLPTTARNQFTSGACSGVENTNVTVISGVVSGSSGFGQVSATAGSPNIMLNGNRIIVSGMYEVA